MVPPGRPSRHGRVTLADRFPGAGFLSVLPLLTLLFPARPSLPSRSGGLFVVVSDQGQTAGLMFGPERPWVRKPHRRGSDRGPRPIKEERNHVMDHHIDPVCAV